MLDMIETMKESEAIEIGLKSGHVVYGKFRGITSGRYEDNGTIVESNSYFIVRDPEGQLVFVESSGANIAYIKLVAADPEISATMDRLYGKSPQKSTVLDEEEPPPRRVDVPPVVLSGAPTSRVEGGRIEEIKEKFRHSTSFTSQIRPAFRPRIETDDGDKEGK